MSRTIRWASLHQELIFYSCIYKICWDCSNKVWYGFCSCITIPGLRTIDSIEIGTWWSRQKWRATILAVLRRNVSEFLGNMASIIERDLMRSKQAMKLIKGDQFWSSRECGNSISKFIWKLMKNNCTKLSRKERFTNSC